MHFLAKGNLHDAYLWAWVFAIRYVESETTLPYVLKHLVTVHLGVLLSWGLLWYFGIREVIRISKSLRDSRTASIPAVLLVLWLAVTYLTIFIGWRFPGHYHLTVLPPLCVLAGMAFSRFIAQNRRSPQPHWRLIRIGIIGAAAVPAITYFNMAFEVPKQSLNFLPIIQGNVDRTNPTDRIFVWGGHPKLYCFSGRRLATRFVSVSHLTGAYAKRPKEITERGESVIPGSWEMFKSDWEAHPPELIIDMSTLDSEARAFAMKRYPALQQYLGAYREEAVINGATIYRRL
jgi:hypothetical protein